MEWEHIVTSSLTLSQFSFLILVAKRTALPRHEVADTVRTFPGLQSTSWLAKSVQIKFMPVHFLCFPNQRGHLCKLNISDSVGKKKSMNLCLNFSDVWAEVFSDEFLEVSRTP